MRIFKQSVFEKWDIEDKSVQALITSPPYYSLRKYSIPDVIIGGNKDCRHEWKEHERKPIGGKGINANVGANRLIEANLRDGSYFSNFCIHCNAWKGQHGLEPSVFLYLAHCKLWMQEAIRVLRDDGIIFINLADTYNGGGRGWQGKNSWIDKSAMVPPMQQKNYPNKSKLLIPERFAILCVDELDLILRNHIVWAAPNKMPESCQDRFSKKWESIFMFTKQPKYYFNLDDIREKQQTMEIENRPHGIERNRLYNYQGKYTQIFKQEGEKQKAGLQEFKVNRPYKERKLRIDGKNPGDVFIIPTQPSPEKHFACVTPDTEILTIEGWKKYTNIPCGSSPKHILVATYNLQKQIIEYQGLSYIKEYDFDGELIKVGNSSIDILMTPNHRNIVRKSTGEEIIVLAEDLAHMDKIRVSAPILYPENNGIGKTLAELVGFIISEGHYKKGRYIEIYQQEGKLQSKRIDFLLNKLEIPYTKHSRNREGRDKKLITWYLKKSPLVEWIIQNIPPKKLTQHLISLPAGEAKALFNGLVAGDGHIRKDDGRICFIQKDRETQGWFQILAMRLGYHSLASGIHVFLTKKQFIGIRNTNGKGIAIKKIQYQGKVWCPKTPNGTWVARRNGRIFITGNTWPEALVKRMILCSTKAGDMVLDCFAGSGTTLRVADELNRIGLGIDLGYSDIQERRLLGIQKELL